VARADVERVQRAERKRDGQATAESRPAVKIDNGTSWFLLRNALGQDVGTRELRVGPEPGNAERIRFEEIVTLLEEENRTIRVQRIETCDRELRAVELHYRETTQGDSAVVQAGVQNGTLTIETLDDCGRGRFEIPRVGNLTFPLLFQERARRMGLKDGETWESDVFDPFVRTIVRRSARGEAPRAIVAGDGAPVVHSSLTVKTRGVECAVWMRGPGDVTREELNGADLVAVRCTEEAARQAEKKRNLTPWLAGDGGGRFQVSLPSEDWKLDKTTADAVALTRGAGPASIVVTALDVPADVTPAGAALLLERRLTQSLGQYQRTGGYEEVRLGSRQAVRFEFTCGGEKGSVAGVGVAVRGKKGAAACVLTGPHADAAIDRRDFERMLLRADFRF
jgi:hypothetical protein